MGILKKIIFKYRFNLLSNRTRTNIKIYIQGLNKMCTWNRLAVRTKIIMEYVHIYKIGKKKNSQLNIYNQIDDMYLSKMLYLLSNPDIGS